MPWTAYEKENLMIKNVLFDMGNVLLLWEPERFVDLLGPKYGALPEDRELLLREIYYSKYWPMLDGGFITFDEAIRAIQKRLPERLAPVVEALALRWPEVVRHNEVMLPLVRTLKKNGYGLYLLTNACITHHEYWPHSPFAPFFEDRIMLSAAHKLLKPDRLFYDRAVALFGLRPDECCFIDDNAVNIVGAEKCAFNGLVFFDEPKLVKDLTEMGIDLSGLEEEREAAK